MKVWEDLKITMPELGEKLIIENRSQYFRKFDFKNFRRVGIISWMKMIRIVFVQKMSESFFVQEMIQIGKNVTY